MQIYKVNKLATYLKHYGVKGMFHKAFSKLYDTDDYENRWETLVPVYEELEKQRKEDFSGSPSVSVLVPVYNPEKTHFSAMLLSVLHQTYPNWELCLVDAGDEKMEDVVDELAGNDSRVRYIKTDNMGISGNTNIALDMARGEYIALLDNDDTLAEDALYRMIKEITKSGADCAYSDEDKMDSEGNRHFCPHIKPDFDEVLLRTNNYICHLFMVKTSIAREVGGFSPETDGAQDFDFIIKCTRVAAKVVHVPHILYHWREHEGSTSGNPLSKMYAYEAGCRAISSFLDSEGRCGKVSMLKDMGYYRVDYELPKELPHVRIVVLGVKDKDYAKTYFSYLRKTTEYENFSICAMWDADAARLSGVSCDAFLVIMAGTMIEDPKWLSKLVADMAQEKMDVVAAKTTINEPYLGMKSINKSFLAFAGREYTDAFGVVHENAGKPAWYKGCFNRTLIACRIEKSPKTGILVKKETYIAMLNEKNYSLAGADMMYEPDVIFARF